MNAAMQLPLLIAPVFLVIAIGAALRQLGWLRAEAEASVMALVVKLLYPCLIFRSVSQAASVRDPGNMLGAPLVGFASVALGIGVSYGLARMLGYRRGAGLRTFAFSAGIYNYGYIPIPLAQSRYDADTVAALFVHNAGCELAIWTVGIALVSGATLREGLAKVLNPAVAALLLGLASNLSGLSERMPGFVLETIDMLAAAAIPIGLVAIGATLREHLDDRAALWSWRTSLGAIALRCAAIPLLMLVGAGLLDLSVELKRVIALQAAMPAGVMPIMLAKHYGGQPVVAVRIVFASTAFSILAIPLWVRFGEWYLGL